MAKKKKKTAYSKQIVLYMFFYALIVDLALLVLAFYCVRTGYTGSLTWFSVGGAFGTTVSLFGTVWAYMNKSKAENTEGGITYETAVAKTKERDC